MRNRSTGKDRHLGFEVINERKAGRRAVGVLMVILAGKRQGNKLTATFNGRMNGDVLKATETTERLG